MNKISRIKIISIDLYRTLIDLEPTAELIWKNFLKDNYPDAISRTYWREAEEISSKSWDSTGIDNEPFKSVRAIFKEICADLFARIELNIRVETAAGILVEKHLKHHFFNDVRPFLETAGKKYPICLSSDCDLDMLNGIDKIYPFDNFFVSEVIRAYKLNPKFFNRVINHYNVRPENILHIGDSKPDIIGPKQLGILACWLNRRNQKWEHVIQPDFEVRSLLEIIDILRIKT